jgi:hypothetical protein
MIINEWERPFTANYDHAFPDTYLCLDTEYTGGDERTDFVMEIGHVMVQERRVVDRLNIVLDWSVHPGTDHELLRYKLNNIQSIMGNDWRITWDVMQKEGIAPYKALKFYRQFFNTWNKRNLPYVAHNGRTAEERMLRGAFNRYLDKAFVIGDNQLWDTGAIFKATRLFESMDPAHSKHRWKCFPQESDSIKDYFNRVLGTRVKGIRWNLKLCLDHYGLTDKLGDRHRYHQAVHDAHCSHLLMEAFRGELDVESLSDVIEERVAVPELKEVPQQPLKEGPREKVRTIEAPTSPPLPNFPKPDESQGVAEDVRAPAPLEEDGESAPHRQPLRGRKRGQRVI